jgi:thiamine pyrophosphate-dependent acetolactate synthase large subunit-like protein
MARLWGGHGVRVATRGALRAALADAATRKTFVLIEACVAPDDHSPLSRKYIERSARRGARAPRSGRGERA